MASRRALWSRPPTVFAVDLLCLIAVCLMAAACSDEAKTGDDKDANAVAEDVSDTAGAVDDSGPIDVGPEDVELDCPGGPGCPCKTAAECDTPKCIDSPDGRVCAQKCVDSCPKGFLCVAGVGDSLSYCLPEHGLICRPCDASADCQQAGMTKTWCVDYEGNGGFCGAFCTGTADCPKGFVCRQVDTVDSGKRNQCVRDDIGGGFGECSCSPAARGGKLATTCWIPQKDAAGKVVGRCKGQRFCGAGKDGGLSACEQLKGSQELCMDTQCDGKKDGTSCEDGNKCTTNDACKKGTCAGGDDVCECKQTADCVDKDGDPCTGVPFCDKSGKVNVCKVNPSTVVTCSPAGNTACRKNACDPKTKKCAFQVEPVSTTCDDGKPCTEGDHCDGKGKCAAGTDKCQCAVTADCAKLEDGNACNGTLYCDKTKLPYTCKINASSVIKCDAKADTACTKNACDAKTGTCKVGPVNDKKACDDGDKCTKGEACTAGKCVGGTATCPCSVHAECADKDDGNLCNGVMYCHKASSTCRVNPATRVYCPAAKDTACLQNKCAPSTGLCGLTIVNDKLVCVDGDPCTKGESCANGECTGGTSLCDCEKNADCADKGGGDKCLGELFCDKSWAKGGQKAQCKPNPAKKVQCKTVDDTVCATNRCDPKTGKCAMKARNDGASCEVDGDPCTVDETCVAGVCKVGKSVCACKTKADCAKFDDGLACNGTLVCDTSLKTPTCVVDKASAVTCKGPTSPCTTRVCMEPKGTCQLTGRPDGAPCDDGDPCTKDEGCFNSKCSKSTKICGCTKDTDCAQFNDTTNKCAGAMSCNTKVGKCVLGPPVVCNDKNVCTTDACESKKGCVYTPKPCVAADKCTIAACHTTLGCQKKTRVCPDDSNPCTEESCDKAKGCESKPITDGTGCKTKAGGDGTCQASVCKPKAPPVINDADRDGMKDSHDVCPTVWNPSQDPKACGSFDKSKWLGGAAIKLATADAGVGKAKQRRTNEVVDIPLANGIVDESLLGHWKLNATLKTHHGGAAAGTGQIVGTPEFKTGPFPAIKTAYAFDGKTDGAVVGKGRTWRLGSRYTVSIWVKEKAAVSAIQPRFLLSSTSGLKCKGKGVAVQITSDKAYGFSGPGVAVFAPRDKDDKWHHIVFTRDGSTFRAFKDGVLHQQTVKATATAEDCGNAFSLGFRYADGKIDTGSFLPAHVAEFAVFKRALGPDEIRAYFTSKAPYGSTFAPGARRSYSDVRVVEFGNKTPHLVHQELIGIRKHDTRDTVGKHLVMLLDGHMTESVAKKSGAKLTGAVKYATGRFGAPKGAVEFDGKTAIDTKIKPVLRDKDGWAIEAWINVPKLPDSKGTIIGAEPATGAVMAFQLRSDGRISLELKTNTGKGNNHAPNPQAHKVTAGRWHHVAVNYDPGGKVRLYVDGLLTATPGSQTTGDSSPTLPLAIGALRRNVGPTSHPFVGRIDELIIHARSRAPGYFRHRARGLAKVRFLASTAVKKHADGTFHPLVYELVWGNLGSSSVASTRITALDTKTTCDHLVSHCLGTVAWWRMEDLGNGMVVDDGAWGQHGVAKLSTGPAPGVAGGGLQVGSGYVEVPHDDRQYLPKYTVEASVRPVVVAVNRAIVSRGSMKNNERWAYHLGFDGLNKLVTWMHANDSKHRVRSQTSFAKNTWASVAAGFDGKQTWVASGGQKIATVSGLAGPYKPTSTLVLGSSRNDAGKVTAAHKGVLDEIRLSNRALQPDEMLHFPAFSHGLVARDPTSCDDGNVCTVDAFNAKGVCAKIPVADGTTCPTGSCDAGVCKAPCTLYDKAFSDSKGKQSSFEAVVPLANDLVAYCGARLVSGFSWAARVGVVNKSGNVSWEKSYGSTDHRCNTARATKDGNVIATGSIKPPAVNHTDAWLLKFAPNGQTLLEANVGGSNDEIGYDVMEFGAGYALAGQRKLGSSGTNAFGWIAKTNGKGVKVWDGSVSVGHVSVMGASVSQAANGGLLAAYTFRSSSSTNRFPHVFRLDANGQTLWDRKLAKGAGISELRFMALPTGTYLGYGATNQKGAGGLDCWLLQLTDVGDVTLDRTYGTPRHDSCSGLAPRNKSAVLAGYQTLKTGATVGWTFGIDQRGDTLWQKTVHPSAGSADLRAVAATKKGRLVYAGHKSANKVKSGWLRHTDGWGEADCGKSGKCASVTDLCAFNNACIKPECVPASGCGPLMIPGCKEAKDMDVDRDELVGSKDTCATVWNPDNDPKACEPVKTADFQEEHHLNIHQPGFKAPYSSQRRTNEPIDIALVNGIRDSSLVGSWHFDNKIATLPGMTNKQLGKIAYGPGPFSPLGLALQLDGSSGVQLGRKFKFADEWTVMMWFMPTKNVSSEQWLVSQLGKSADSNGWKVYRQGSSITVQLGNFGSGTAIKASATGIQNDRWHHVAVRRHMRSIELWLDGVQRAVAQEPKTYSTPTKAPKDFGDPIAVGHRNKQNGSPANFFVGRVDDLLVFSRPLSAREMRIYFASKKPYGSALISGTRPDFAGLRVTERNRVGGGETHTHFELRGLRQFGDTALSEVFTYAPLGPSVNAAKGQNGQFIGKTKWTSGRFGGVNTAIQLDGNSFVQTSFSKRPSALATTAELFFKLDANAATTEGLIHLKRHVGISVRPVSGATRLYGELFFKDNPSKAIPLAGVTDLVVGRWYHAAVVYDGKAGRMYLDGRLESQFAKSNKLGIASGIAGYFFGYREGKKVRGALDEIIIHNVARSANWIANRARGLPSIRFLASTEPHPSALGAYRFNQYRLRWKMKTPVAKPTSVVGLDQQTTCDGVLSKCLGYAAYWRFEGEFLEDETAYRHRGELKGAARLDAGRSGGGLHLDGSVGTWGEVKDNKALQLASQYTVEASFRPAVTSGRRCLLAKGTDPHNYAMCSHSGKQSGDTLEVMHNKAASKDLLAVSLAPPLQVNSWYHVASTYEAGKLQAFLDGTVVGSKTGANKPATSASVITLGSRLAAGKKPNFAGRLDNVRIMNRALTADELLHHPPAEPPR